jgi:hypothetical protein
MPRSLIEIEIAGFPPIPDNVIDPNYQNFNDGPLYLAIVTTFVSTALIVFMLRAYTRARILHFFGIDDWLMLIAAVSLPEDLVQGNYCDTHRI